MKQINAIILEPQKTARVEMVDGSLEGLQALVGGYIEVVRIASDVCFIADEEGLLKGLPYNFSVCGTNLFGTAVFCGVEGEDFTDMPVTFEQAKRLFPEMWGV